MATKPDHDTIRADLAVLAAVLPKLTVTMDQLSKRLAKPGAFSPVDRMDTSAACKAASGVLRQASFVAAVAAKNI